ncbi:ribonuclease D [Candidatus Tenderia electrophaga]|jgi:ribonuclease D|uniref:Ribonuclease D n=1 Tax=Candidatus Tenderia electrophaga TaxID=1748243 RepID=A0A0S2TAP5_9GAMM|nr:ribonuclease D [Candidatus Tenderia electrophaga]
METRFINQPADLEHLCRELAHSSFVAVDTEFVREQTYYPQLALIQIADDTRIACIDPLAIEDLSPLKALFANPAVTKVFHAADQDLEIFYLLFGELPQPLFDTQVAATVLGQGEQIGYAALVKDVLDIELDKSHTRTDWLQRPLDAKQISYAEDDVRHLARLYPLQLEALQRQGRADWLDEDFAALIDPTRYQVDPQGTWQRVKGSNKLRGVQLAILQQLCAWREQLAMDKDKPRRWIAADNVVLDIARLRPKDLKALEKIRGIPTGLVQRNGQRLLQCVREGEALPKDEWPTQARPKRLTDADDALVDVLSAIVKLSAAEHRISPATLAGRKALEALVRGERELPILTGWRRRHGGQQLLDFLSGDGRLAVQAGRLNLTP